MSAALTGQRIWRANMKLQASLIKRIAAALGVLVVHTWLSSAASAQDPGAWRDPSKHEVAFITVDQDVQLEVLDWGGSGRALVLLAGSGNTAHVFDDFAPKLTDGCHVYGITRRGFGSSSHPPAGYDDQRLADDALKVLDALHLEHPVLAGHSMAGGELTTIGRQHSERISGLIYLDATTDPVGDPSMSDPEFVAAEKKLPDALRQPPAMDRSSVAAFQASRRRTNQGAFPESEVRQAFAILPDGRLGQYKASTRDINDAIGKGQIKRDYSSIRAPVLAFINYPRPPGDPQSATMMVDDREYQPVNDDERAAIIAYARVERRRFDQRIATFKRSVPSARVVELPGAGHYVFLTREGEILSGMHGFVTTLK
jgi:pimeloyl-ACP methyl ester carboxylesterase